MNIHASPQPAASPAQFDQPRCDAFLGRMLRGLNDAAVIVMISLGHRLHLFDAMSGGQPATVSRLAKEAGLQERYVKEWLAVMTVGGIVEFDAEAQSYRLPLEHAAWLTRSAPKNLAISAQFIPVIAGVESDLAERFRNGGGLQYRCYHRFHDVMGEASAQTVRAALDTTIVPLVPRLEQKLAAGIDVLDVGCGTAPAILHLAARYPRSRFVGYDLCEETIATARSLARSRNLSNVRFEVRDLPGSSLGGPYDLITAFDAVHDQRDPAALLAAVRKGLASDGAFLMQDIAGSSYLENNLTHPFGAFLYAISCAHCTSISLGQGGPGLGTMWGEELAQRMLAEAGFSHVTLHRIKADPVGVYFVARP